MSKKTIRRLMGRPSTSPAYWEKVLISHGLGVDQPLTDNSNELTTGEATGVDKDDFLHLRRTVDKGDRFMEGHEIKKIRKLQERELTGQKIEWAFNDKRVQEILLLAFPNLNVNESQRRRAGRWARVIYLYYRVGLPRQIIQKETKMSESALKTLLRNINRVARGLRADGIGKRACHPSPLLRGIGERTNE